MSVARKRVRPLVASIGAAPILIVLALSIATAAQAPPVSSSAPSGQTASTQTIAAQTAPLAFDAASIKERDGSVPLSVVGLQFLPGRVVAHCVTLKSLMFYAYGLTLGTPIERLPDWANTPCSTSSTKDTYDFQATMPVDATQDQRRQMMQTLLSERFKLAVHWEKKPMPIYALVVARGGFKLKPADPADSNKPVPAGALRCPPDDPRCSGATMYGTMAQFAAGLALSAGRPVIDKTGITGYYSGILKWASDTAPNSSLPSFATAVRETFGLELKSETGPVDVLVVDHAERPTPN